MPRNLKQRVDDKRGGKANAQSRLTKGPYPDKTAKAARDNFRNHVKTMRTQLEFMYKKVHAPCFFCLYDDEYGFVYHSLPEKLLSKETIAEIKSELMVRAARYPENIKVIALLNDVAE